MNSLYKSLLMLILFALQCGVDHGAFAQSASRVIHSHDGGSYISRSVGENDLYFIYWDNYQKKSILMYYAKGDKSATEVATYSYNVSANFNKLWLVRSQDSLYLFNYLGGPQNLKIDIFHKGQKYGELAYRYFYNITVQPSETVVYYHATSKVDDETEERAVYAFDCTTRKSTKVFSLPTGWAGQYATHDTLLITNGRQVWRCSKKPNDTALLVNKTYHYTAHHGRVFFIQDIDGNNYTLKSCDLSGRLGALNKEVKASRVEFRKVNDKLIFSEELGLNYDVYFLEEDGSKAIKAGTSLSPVDYSQILGNSVFLHYDKDQKYVANHFRKQKTYMLHSKGLLKNTDISLKISDMSQHSHQDCQYYHAIPENGPPMDTAYFLKICRWDTSFKIAFGGAFDYNKDSEISLWHIWDNTIVYQQISSDGKFLYKVKEDVGTYRRTHKPPTVELYPNPTHSTVQLKVENELETSVQVFSFTGKPLPNTYHADAGLIDLSNKAPGIYLVRITTSKGTVSHRVVKQ